MGINPCSIANICGSHFQKLIVQGWCQGQKEGLVKGDWENFDLRLRSKAEVGPMAKDFIFESLKLIPVYLLFLGTFGQASSEKFLSGGVPAWFLGQFEKTKLNLFPGSLTIQFYLIACLEALVVVAFLMSAGHLEFLMGHPKTYLKAGLVLALFTFFALGFGLRMSGDYQGAANLFSYFGVTFLIFMYVEQFAHVF